MRAGSSRAIEELDRQGRRMAKRIAPIGVISLVLLAAGRLAGQNPAESLPDAPSVRAVAPSPPPTFSAFGKAHSTLVAVGSGYAQSARESKFLSYDKARTDQKDPRTVFNKYLKPPMPNKKLGYSPMDTDSLVGRAAHAASRVFVTWDESGKGRVNTSYFLQALTTVAADTASRPYWRRSVGEPFSDLGSTVGNDAGMNVLHEFEPSLQQVLKTHAPRFVSRIGQRIGHS
jgi:hypothetical protein